MGPERGRVEYLDPGYRTDIYDNECPGGNCYGVEVRFKWLDVYDSANARTSIRKIVRLRDILRLADIISKNSMRGYIICTWHFSSSKELPCEATPYFFQKWSASLKI